MLLTIDMLRDGFDRETLFVGSGFTALNVVIILYLLRPQVKEAFGRRSHSAGGSAEVQKSKRTMTKRPSGAHMVSLWAVSFRSNPNMSS